MPWTSFLIRHRMSTHLPCASQGNYPVVMEDAAQMAALQTHAEFGPTLLDNADALEGAIERFITKQVRSRKTCLKV